MSSSDNSSSTKSVNKLLYAFIIVALLGLGDAIWLTKSYYDGHITCSVIGGCLEVLKSQYSAVAGVPIALLGAGFYAMILVMSLYYLYQKNNLSLKVLKIFPIFGFLFSLWLVYLQIFVIKAICIYCMFSAGTSTLIFILSLILIIREKSINPPTLT